MIHSPHPTYTDALSRERRGLRLPPLPPNSRAVLRDPSPGTPSRPIPRFTIQIMARDAPRRHAPRAAVPAIQGRPISRLAGRHRNGIWMEYNPVTTHRRFPPEGAREAPHQVPDGNEIHAIGRIFAQSKVSNRVRSERKQHHDSNDVPRKSGFLFHRAAPRPPPTAFTACPWTMSFWPASCARPDLTS